LISGYHSLLYITSPASIETVANIGQCFTWRSNLTFSNISGDLTYWTYDLSVARNHNWTGCILWVQRDYLYTQVTYFMGRGARAILVDTSSEGTGQLSLTNGYEANLYKWDDIVFQVSEYYYTFVVEVPGILTGGENISVVITNEDNYNSWEAFDYSWITWFIQIFLVVETFFYLGSCCI